jgi:hypothetical protein
MIPEGSIPENGDEQQTWQPAGADGQPSVEELASRHHQTEVPANIPAPPPGLPLPGVSGASGVRVPPYSNDWRDRVRGKKNWTQEL